MHLFQYDFHLNTLGSNLNKTVLLRERKRHTPSLAGGYHPDLAGGTPSQGTPPPVRTWLGYPPGKGPGTSHWGTLPERTWDQLKYYGMKIGYPPRVWTDKQTETITFPHPSDAGGNKSHL